MLKSIKVQLYEERFVTLFFFKELNQIVSGSFQDIGLIGSR